MTANTVHTRATRADLRRALATLPAVATGSGADARAILARIGLTVLGHVRRAFITKARGGTDEAGDRWQPLSPRTVAYSKTRSRGRGGRTRAERGRAARPSQALTAKQQARWWALYRQGLAMFGGDRAGAARRAWAILKREGATTLLQKYGGRKVEILRDTGLLLNSLSPGTAGAPATPEQVFRVGAGAVVVGTNRRGAAAHHRGVPGRLPQRRLWPRVGSWPSSWWQDITDQARAGLLDLAARIMGGAR